MTTELPNIPNAEDRLASRWIRLAAAITDSLISVALTIPVMMGLGVFEDIENGQPMSLSMTLGFAAYGWALFFLLHGHLLNQYGQTIGKKLLNIAIVDLNGNKPDFWPLIGKRYVPVALVAYIPLIGTILTLVNVLFIFRDDKRCVHDHIAGTIVVKAEAVDHL